MLVCNKCKTDNIKVKGWIDPNYLMIEPFWIDDFEWDSIWCDRCDEEVELEGREGQNNV